AESVQQGELAAIAVNPVGTLALLWLAARGALGRLGDAENITGFSFRSLTVMPLRLLQRKSDAQRVQHRWHKGDTRPVRIKVAADGEIMSLDAPLEFRVAPESLLLIMRSRHAAHTHMEGDAA